MTATTLGTIRRRSTHERARLARELHDGISQTLYAIILSAARARLLCERNQPAEAQSVIDAVLRLAGDGQAEVRALLGDSRSESLTRGNLTGALTTLSDAVRMRSGLEVRLSVAHEPAVSSTVKDELMMISHEALHNIERRASATHVDIVVEVAVHAVVLLITDNGDGFDPEPLCAGHFGLQSIQERAAAIGATLELSSTDGIGTRVRVAIPTVTSDG